MMLTQQFSRVKLRLPDPRAQSLSLHPIPNAQTHSDFVLFADRAVGCPGSILWDSADSLRKPEIRIARFISDNHELILR